MMEKKDRENSSSGWGGAGRRYISCTRWYLARSRSRISDEKRFEKFSIYRPGKWKLNSFGRHRPPLIRVEA